jgi:hypothetical protein
VVSSDNLNVIYAGVANPFSVSVPGFVAEDVSAAITEGSFSKISSGKYEAFVNGSSIGHQINISVTAKMPDGTTKKIAQLPYKIRAVPPPVATVNGKYDGKISKNEMLAAGKVTATLNNFYFQNVKYDVTSYRCVYLPRNNTAAIAQDHGNPFSSQLINYIQNSRSGDRFIFERIMSNGPGGVKYPLNIISLEIK